MTRSQWIQLFSFIAMAVPVAVWSAPDHSQGRPNIIVILADDLGYGDTGVYGADLIETPNIDALANEGVRLTQFYTSGNICSPSRAGLYTGRYPIRSGLANTSLAINDARGLRPEEVTLPEQLKSLGYTTALIGKWHQGDQAEYLPQVNGFDEFFGILHSNDELEQPLLRGKQTVQSPIDPQMLAAQFTSEAVDYVNKSGSQPFFLMLSMTSPHKPLLPSPRFARTSKAGAYGDVVQELDWSVGEVLRALQSRGLSENTMVIFTSDNGPFPEGSTAGLLGGKGTAWEGGYRVPFIARWPQAIKPGTVSAAMAMNIDLMPTLIRLAGGSVPATLQLDGKDISSLLQGSDESPHEVLYFFHNERIAALRTEDWRLMLSDYPPWRDSEPIRFEGKPDHYTLLHDMRLDPIQQYDLSRDFPDQKKQLETLLETGRADLESLSTQPDSTQFGDLQ